MITSIAMASKNTYRKPKTQKKENYTNIFKNAAKKPQDRASSPIVISTGAKAKSTSKTPLSDTKIRELRNKVLYAKEKIQANERGPRALGLGRDKIPAEILNETDNTGNTILNYVNTKKQRRIESMLERMGAKRTPELPPSSFSYDSDETQFSLEMSSDDEGDLVSQEDLDFLGL